VFTEAEQAALVHNVRSREVMERLGLRHRKDIQVDGEPFALYAVRVSCGA
jgi:hypothetical protein